LPTMVSPEGVGSAAQAPPARAVGRHRADDPQPGEQTYPAPDHALGLPVLRRGRSAAHPPRTWPRMGPGAPAAARPPASARPPWARLRRIRSIDQLTVRKVERHCVLLGLLGSRRRCASESWPAKRIAVLRVQFSTYTRGPYSMYPIPTKIRTYSPAVTAGGGGAGKKKHSSSTPPGGEGGISATTRTKQPERRSWGDRRN